MLTENQRNYARSLVQNNFRLEHSLFLKSMHMCINLHDLLVLNKKECADQVQTQSTYEYNVITHCAEKFQKHDWTLNDEVKTYISDYIEKVTKSNLRIVKNYIGNCM